MTANELANRIKKIKWLSRWAGSYTFISCSYWGGQYFHTQKKELGLHFAHTLFIHRKGVAAFYLPKSQFRKFGMGLARRAEKNKAYAIRYCRKIKHSTDLLLPMMKKMRSRIPTHAQYQIFAEAYANHLPLHTFIKKTIDFLTPKSLEALLPYFKDARLYSESIYSESERFFRNLAKLIARKEKHSVQYLTCLTQTELETYLRSGVLPNQNILKQRFLASVLYFENGREYIFTGQIAGLVEKSINKTNVKTSTIRGTTAYPGKVRGRARIILDPNKVKIFNKGDILITGMTRPEFIPLIRKAGALVTDVGGVLCHAAVTARELKIPCVVGTAVATKVFKDGVKVQVDATKAIIKVKE